MTFTTCEQINSRRKVKIRMDTPYNQTIVELKKVRSTIIKSYILPLDILIPGKLEASIKNLNDMYIKYILPVSIMMNRVLMAMFFSRRFS